MSPWEPPPVNNTSSFVHADHASLFPTLPRLDVKDIRTDRGDIILDNGKTRLYRYNNRALVSLRRDIDVVVKEVERMLTLAPLNISIPVLGIVFDGTRIDGYIMPLTRSVPSNIHVSTKREYRS